MVERKDNDHANIITELEKRFKDIAKNTNYGSHISCNEGDSKPDEKKEGDEKTKKRKKDDVKLCKHRDYGCTIGDAEKKKSHLIKVSNYFMFNGKSKEEIASVR